MCNRHSVLAVGSDYAVRRTALLQKLFRPSVPRFINYAFPAARGLNTCEIIGAALGHISLGNLVATGLLADRRRTVAANTLKGVPRQAGHRHNCGAA